MSPNGDDGSSMGSLGDGNSMMGMMPNMMGGMGYGMMGPMTGDPNMMMMTGPMGYNQVFPYFLLYYEYSKGTIKNYHLPL